MWMLRMFVGTVLDPLYRLAALRAISRRQTFGPPLVRRHSKGSGGLCTRSRRRGLFPEQNLLR
jgi:hypothetical protein